MTDMYTIKKVPSTPLYIHASLYQDDYGYKSRYRVLKTDQVIGSDGTQAFKFGIPLRTYRNILYKNGGITCDIVTYFESYKNAVYAAKELHHQCRFCAYIKARKRGHVIKVSFSTKTMKSLFSKLYVMLKEYPKAEVIIVLENGEEVSLILQKNVLNRLKKTLLAK